MRFRFKPILFTLLFSIAHPCNAELLAPRSSDALLALAETTQETTTKETPAVMEADSLSGKKDNQIEATGNATFQKDGQSIRADSLLYSQDTKDIDAQGSVVLEQEGSTLSGPHLKINLDTGIGVMEQPRFFPEGK